LQSQVPKLGIFGLIAREYNMNFSQTQFLTSASALSECPVDSEAEVAFAGRSNAGKSSAINSICSQSGLARTSKTPGRTQLINFFAIEPASYLVDLPGYGFAKVPLRVKNKWQKELEKYLSLRKPLVGLILLTDIRHPLKDHDLVMIDWAVKSSLPLHLLLTKSDKLKKGAAQNALLKVRAQIGPFPNVTVQLFSAFKTVGIAEAREVINGWFTRL
jgi:GTP-binding protein